VSAPKILLKDQLFNRDRVTVLAGELAAVHPPFHAGEFVEEVMGRLGELELKERIAWIATCLSRFLPDDYRQAVGVILDALPAPNDPTLSDGDFGDFIYAPYAEYVARHGCTAEDLDFSLAALRELTMRFSAEDAIRTFINAFPDATMRTLHAWASGTNYHVRRLCSEGTRPRLPWSRRLVIPAADAIGILDLLYTDPTRYVTRSVANHVNDIAKADPDLAVDTLVRWRQDGRQDPREMAFIVRHATRSLVKAGHPRAMELLGLTAQPRLSVLNLTVPAQVPLDTALEFSFDLRAHEDSDLVVDYAIRFQGPAGRPGGRKVFKLRRLSLAGGEQVPVAKRHLLRSDMTTRRLHPGGHELEIQINGTVHATRQFQVT
jgi:3-methyladenine DNA glycosylase AlkC